MHHLTDRITHTTAFVTPVVEHWLKQEILSVRPNAAINDTKTTTQLTLP